MIKTLTSLAIAFTINVNAQIITTFAGNGMASYSGDGGQATNAELWGPDGIAIDAVGNLFIADLFNYRIRKVTTAGIITTIAGNGTQGFSGDGGAATAAELYNPYGVACDVFGNLYIADYTNHRVRMVNTIGIISTVAGNGTPGVGGDGGQATAAELSQPDAVACDAAGNLYISDLNAARIRMVNTLGIISTVAGTYTLGPGFSGDGGQATDAQLSNPYGVACDASGNLYIADEGNSRIRMVNTSGIIITFAGNGIMGHTGDGGLATAAELSNPYGITFDASGNLYIGDEGNNNIRKVTTAGIITTIAGNGTQGFSGDGGAATAAEFIEPGAVACDVAGNLYINDGGNNRIRKVTNAAVTDIQQFENSNEQVKIYPNPNNGSFVIEPNSAEKQTVQVYDVSGKMVLSQAINGKATIDASSLNEGVYQVSIQSSDYKVTKRLVIVR